MKRFLTTLFITCLAAAVYAQNGKVTMTVVDSQTKEGVAGAVIEFKLSDGSADPKYYTSGFNGKADIAGLKSGEYDMTISFLGYDDLAKKITVTASTKDLGTFELTQSTTKIETVVKEVQSIRTSQKGDTVSYNAEAFKVANDADMEGLLKKMPGITITNGTVEAQGETVQKIFVDGKEFFGEDVATALNSLPAQAVKSVEVYNKLSDNAEFSGMDDGEGYKAINIVTHETMRQGFFGKLYAGYGYQPETDEITNSNKYILGGNVNMFHGSSRVSLIGLLNNINQQNFSFEDILDVSGSTGGMGGGMGGGVGQYMVRPQSGVANVGSIGVNYSDSWGEDEKVKLQASYFFNRTRTRNLSQTTKWYEAPLEDLGTLEQEGRSDNLNYNNRLNARVDWRIAENHSMMSRTNLSFQTYDPFSETSGKQYGDNLYNIIANGNDANRGGFNLNEFIQYRVKLGKAGRLLTADFRLGMRDNNNDSKSYSNQETIYDENNVPKPLLRHLKVETESDNTDLAGSLTYAEPVSKHSQVTLSYRLDYSGQQRDKQTYNYGTDDTYTNGTLDQQLSNMYKSDYTTHRVGPGFRFSKEKNTVVVNLNYQYSTLNGRVEAVNTQPVKRNYNNFTYFLMGNFNINPQNSIRLFVMSSTNEPRITQLQNLLDISDMQYVSRGNENLNPAYSHRINFHYNNTNLEKGRTFMWMFSFQSTQDYISSSMYTGDNIPQQVVDEVGARPIQYSTYDNVDGYMSLRTHISYGLPINPIKCNLNMMAGVTYSKVPSLVNGERNMASNMGYDANVVLGSNISENVDFTLAWNGTYNVANNSLASGGSRNEYLNHSATGSLKTVFWKGFTFTVSASYVQYVGFTNDYNDSYTLCNAYIGKKVFRNQLGEIMVGVNDIFNQNTAFTRTTGSGYTQNAWNSVIGRYFTVQFNYNLRVFGKRGSRVLSDYGISDGKGSGMRRMGPPPMGGPGGPH